MDPTLHPWLSDAIEARVNERTRTLVAANAALEAQCRELEATNARLQRLVSIDPLTGIPNRRQFDEALDRELRRAYREGQPLSLLLCDIDGFKRFNDTYGHARGDATLRRVAQALAGSFRRGSELAARYGGEEFVVVLPGADARRGTLFGERLRRSVWRLAIASGVAPVADRVTISVGVATLAPGSLPEAAHLVEAADAALYRAKHAGRNRVVAVVVDPAAPQQRLEFGS
jgi:diguanylate cyclase